MTLIDLKEHLKAYKSNHPHRGWSPFVLPYHDRALQIEGFIQSLPEKPENEPLTEKELHELIILTKDMSEDLGLVAIIKYNLSNDPCLRKAYDLLSILEPLDLPNDNLIYYLNEITELQTKILEKLSEVGIEIDVMLISYLVMIQNNEALNSLLDFFISVNLHLQPEHIELMVELDRESKLELHAPFDMLQNQSAMLKNQFSTNDFPRLLNLLTQDLVELEQTIKNRMKSMYNKKIKDHSLKLSGRLRYTYDDIEKTLTLLLKNDLIDEAFSLVENDLNQKSSFYYDLKKFITLLNSKSMLTPESYQVFFEMTCIIRDNKTLYGSDIFKILEYLNQKKDLLSYDALLTLADQVKNRTLFKLLNLFKEKNFLPFAEQFNQILSMPYNALRRLHGMLRNPIKSSRLDEKMLARCISIIVDFKLKPAPMFFAKQKENPLKIKINDGLTLFRNENAKEESGSFGEVTKARANDGRFFAVKKFKENCWERYLTPLKEGGREAKRNQLLNRDTAYSEGGVVIYPWQYDKVVTNFTEEEFKNSTYIDRLKCLTDVLNELSILHANYQVHGDIKGLNCALSLTNKTMNLIDFGSSRKFGVSTHKNNFDFPFTSIYSDKSKNMYDFCDDIYSLGLTFAFIFPELYENNLKDLIGKKLKNNEKLEIAQIKESETPLEKAVCLLIENITSDNRAQRCLAEDALKYCDRLVLLEGDISEDELDSLLHETIWRDSTTEEDLIRNRMWETA